MHVCKRESKIEKNAYISQVIDLKKTFAVFESRPGWRGLDRLAVSPFTGILISVLLTVCVAENPSIRSLGTVSFFLRPLLLPA